MMNYETMLAHLADMKLEMDSRIQGLLKEDDVDGDHVAYCKQRLTTLEDIEFALRELVEPWRCVQCDFTTKIPKDKENLRACSSCGVDSMLPYGYQEQARMSAQMTSMLKFLSACADTQKPLTVDLVRQKAAIVLDELPIIGRRAQQSLLQKK